MALTLEYLNDRIDAFEKSTNERFTALEVSINARITALEESFDRRITKLEQDVAEIKSDIRDIKAALTLGVQYRGALTELDTLENNFYSAKKCVSKKKRRWFGFIFH
jgi:hypothetical protein